MREETAEQKNVSAHVRNRQAGQDALTDGSYGRQDHEGLKQQQGPHQAETCRPCSRSDGEHLKGISKDS